MYINQNVKLKVGGRKAPKMSIQDLKDLFLNDILNCKEEFLEYVIDCDVSDPNWKSELTKYWNDPSNEEERNYSLLMYISEVNDTGKWTKLWKDLEKIENDWENCGVNSWGITSTDIPYIERWSGGDWEQPICSHIYWDGKYFRGYVPSKGNPINLSAKSAFGNNDEIFHSSGIKNFTDLTNCTKEEKDDYLRSDFYYFMTQVYPNDPMKYLLNKTNYDLFVDSFYDLKIDYSSCREDFETRVKAI